MNRSTMPEGTSERKIYVNDQSGEKVENICKVFGGNQSAAMSTAYIFH